MRPAAAVGFVLLARLAAAEEPVAWPRLSSGPLQDNSFLVEEAYNQERGVVQHILNANYDPKSGHWIGSFTQEWPVPDETHQLSFTLLGAWSGGADDGRGFGDMLLNYRYQLLAESERCPAMAPRLSVILPTGDYRHGVGNGSAGLQTLLPVSKQLDEHVAAHLNLGATWLPAARDASAPSHTESLASWNAGASVIWEPWNAINFLAEIVYFRDAEIVRRGVDYEHHAIFDPGVRIGWNGPWGVQWVGGVGVPIGLTRTTNDLGVFLYFSIEHAVTAAARAEREW